MVKNLLMKFVDMLGFGKTSKYVQKYLHKTNIRSGLFMGAVVVILEIWLVIRQHNEYIIAKTIENGNYFKNVFDYTSLYWLLMFMGITMFAYCIYYLRDKKGKNEMIAIIAIAAVGVILCCLLPSENRIQNPNPKRVVDTVLLIVFYASIFLFQASVIFAAIYSYKGGKAEWITSVLIVTLFALCCLVFGVKVSYSDFFSTKDQKQIICFLTMVIYVACLLIWRPYLSVGLLGMVFLGFYFMLKANSEARVLPDGDELNYITFFISLSMVSISIFNQRLLEARKDEELEILATTDKLTGLLRYTYFLTLVDKKIKDEDLKESEWAYLFLDVSNFKVYNDQKGYKAGDAFLINVGKIISNTFPNCYLSRQSDDHYAVFVPNVDLFDKLDEIRAKVRDLDFDIKPNIIIGYYILTKENGHYLDSHTSIEKARYACAELKKRHGNDYLAYDEQMHDRYNLVQYIVSKIDEAIANNWIVVYYQPVIYSKDGKLCGVEALARWIDPKYGFLNPGVFIPTLEDAQLAYKLDLAMLELVCHNMREVLDKGEKIVPTSINFSRADFSAIDIPNEVVRITKKYNIPAEYLHIEITESALLDERVDLVDAMNRLKANGFALWLDDFGSGYSSFNSLKDYDFDVLKLDMEFLKGFDKNKKSRPLIESVINMANQIGMRTLCEGVETSEQMAFLKQIDCERLQGYLFSKPIAYDELNKMIKEGKLVISDTLI